MTGYDWLEKFNANIRRNNGLYNQREEIGTSRLNSKKKNSIKKIEQKDNAVEDSPVIDKRQQKKLYYEQHKEEIIKRQIEYSHKNRDKINAKRRETYAKKKQIVIDDIKTSLEK